MPEEYRMIESLSSAIDRIDDIKSHFRSGRVNGVVTIAPHTSVGSVGPRGIMPAKVNFSSMLDKSISEMSDTADADNETKPTEFEDTIQEASSKWGVDPALIKAVIQAESGFNPKAVSYAGAQGLMQLMPSTAKSVGISNPFDPTQNIMGGTRYLKGQLERFNNNVELALAAYNAGPGAVRKYGGVPPYTQTQNYVKKVLDYKDSFSR